jgi:hypothetical protein
MQYLLAGWVWTHYPLSALTINVPKNYFNATVACAAVAMQWKRDRRINKGVMQSVSKHRIGKKVVAATNTNATMELLLEKVFSTRSVQRGHKENNWGRPSYLRVESWVLQERLRKDGAIVQLTVQLWDICRAVTTWAQNLKNLQSCELLPSND